MANGKSRVVRLNISFIEDCLDKIIEIEKNKGRDDTSYTVASKILRDRIINAGGIK